MKTYQKVLISLSVIIVVALAATSIYVVATASTAHLDPSKLANPNRSVKMVAYDGTDISGSGGYVDYEDIPRNLINAFVAVEDKRFWAHNGVDVRRIVGATLANVKSGSLRQGASTITCQLVKNTHLDQSKTLSRKIKEAKLALEVEKAYTKEEILEMYLNVIYFGQGLYGVGAAANGFFGVKPKDLTLAQCASIAATVVNPAKYSPRLDENNNVERRNMVLTLMQQQGYIDQEECQVAKDSPLLLASETPDPYRSYRAAALNEAATVTGIDPVHLIGEGYVIHTYCDSTIQRQNDDLIRSDLPSKALDETRPDSMALTMTTDGKITSYSSDFALGLASVYRSPGSMLKPFIYATAIEQNILLPMSPLSDEITSFGDYTPANYHGIYYGNIPASTALAKSSNVCAVKVLTYAGLDNVVTNLIALGLPIQEEDRHLALALGGLSKGVRIDQLAAAYCSLANGGMSATPTMIDYVTDKEGIVVYRNSPSTREVYTPETAYLTSTMLNETVTGGTATKLSTLGGTLYAKTGTVAQGDGNSDAWCVAYDKNALAISWVGNLSMEPAHAVRSTGGGDAALLVRELLGDHTGEPIPTPEGVALTKIDRYTWQNDSLLMQASPNTPGQYLVETYVKTDHPLPTSTTFEVPPTVEPIVSVKDHHINIQIKGNPLCSYRLQYDMGFWSRDIDLLKGDDISKTYTAYAGLYVLTPILHGKTDVEGTPYRVWVY